MPESGTRNRAARRLYHDGSAVSEVLRMSEAATRAQDDLRDAIADLYGCGDISFAGDARRAREGAHAALDALVAELERVTRERDEALEQAALQEAAIVGQMKARERETQLREALALAWTMIERAQPDAHDSVWWREQYEVVRAASLAGLPSVPPEGQS